MAKTKKRRIRYDRILIFVFVVLIFICCLVLMLNRNITNIFISNNTFLKDQFIIEAAGIDNYPSTLLNPSFAIKNRLKKNVYINDV